MAIYDDYDGKEIKGVHISVRSIRLEYPSGRYRWIGDMDVKRFQDERTLANWVRDQMVDLIDNDEYPGIAVHVD